MHNPVHPGEILKELVLDAMELKITGAARYYDINFNGLTRIINRSASSVSEISLDN
jgi:plasmid maintenance system antidote protein VapI